MAQDQWRFCGKCKSIFFNGFPDKGVCRAGGGHDALGFNFLLNHDIPLPPDAQPDWRFCGKCFTMFFDGSPNKGACPAGEGHNAQGSRFVISHDIAPLPNTQNNWRFCRKCFTMFFDGAPDKGACPTGGGHEAQGFNFVLPHLPVENRPLNIWTDSLRCHSETPGFGIGEGDEPFVIISVIDLERVSSFGIPETQCILYGPLDDVDDQENHTFPFNPFWSRPYKAQSVIFLIAALEFDNLNPELTRSAVAVALQASVAATAGAARERIIAEAASAISAAAEPVQSPGIVNRLIGPPQEVFFTLDDVFHAQSGGDARQIRRFNAFGDYSIHFLARAI